MILLDVNVVVAAFRGDHPHHDRVRPWLTRTLDLSIPLAVPDVVWVGFVRLSTNSRLFPVASTIDETLAFARALVAQPGDVHLGGRRDGIEPFVQMVGEASAGANLTTHAYVAAVASAWAADIATFDRDFRRFDGLRIIEPGVDRRRRKSPRCMRFSNRGRALRRAARPGAGRAGACPARSGSGS